MLRIEIESAGYGGPAVLSDIRIELAAGQVLALLGRNGAGKSTLLKSVMGLLPRVRGANVMDGRDLRGLPTHQIARLGIAYVPQGRGIFPRLTVRENLETGTRAAGRPGSDIPDSVFSYFPILKSRLGQNGGTMSGGEQQMLAIARALCGRPRVLLLDEPSDGIQPSIVQMLGELIPALSRDAALAVLLVEQNLDLALSSASTCWVMDRGTIAHRGSAADLSDPALVNRLLAI